MKKTSLIFYSMLILFAACTNAPDSDKATTEEAKEVDTPAGGKAFNVDPASSTIKWIGTKVSGIHVGTIPVKSGELQVNDGAISGGTFTMDMTRLAVTGPEGSKPEGNTKLQGHLHSADFFEVEKYPEAKFEITAVSPFSGAIQDEEDPRQAEINEYKVANPTHTVSGNLTIKDITKNIQFPAQITVNENSIDAVAKFNIDRTQWNITYPGQPDDLIKKDVHLGIALKAVK